MTQGISAVYVTSQKRVDVTVFTRKLRNGVALTEEDEIVLKRLLTSTFSVLRGDIWREGAEPRSVPLIVQGWACRYRQLENGKRQITSVYLPGDLCEPFGSVPSVTDHTIAALTPVLLFRIPPQDLRAAARENANVEKALWWDLLLTDGIAREHAVNLGRRSATERLSHFFCELHVRLGMVGLCDTPSFELPLTQIDLADLFGLSPVHVNRSIQELRGSGLMSLRDRRVTLHDVDAMRELSMFDPAYLRVNSLNSNP